MLGLDERQILAPFDEPLVIENQQQTVVALLKPRFNAADQFGQVAVLEDGHAEVPRGGDQQPDLFGPVHENTAGVEIRDVAESLHRLPYALAHLRRMLFARSGSLSTRETVLIDTPASCATSRMELFFSLIADSAPPPLIPVQAGVPGCSRAYFIMGMFILVN